MTEHDGVLTITIDRQPKRNAISTQVSSLLWDGVRQLARRAELRVMVITAVGPYFSAGIDIADRGRDPDEFDGAMEYRRNYRNHHLFYDELESVEKPVIHAANGICLGAGLEMAVSCDFRLASTEAAYALPEIKMGVMPGSGGVSRLTRIVGPHWGKWIAMIGRTVSADQALHIGLVHEVYPAAEFAERVQQFARSLCEVPMRAMGLTKIALDATWDVDRGTARHIERIANSQLVLSSDFRRRVEEQTAKNRNNDATT